MKASDTAVKATHKPKGCSGKVIPRASAAPSCSMPALMMSKYRATTVLSSKVPAGSGARR